MADANLTVLLMWHIGSVIIWLGSSAMFVLAVSPSVRSMGQAEKEAFLRSFLPRFARLLGGASISAVAAGVLLFGYVSTVGTAVAPEGWRFVSVLVGALLGLLAAVLTVGVALPLMSRFMDPASQVKNDPKYTFLDEQTMVRGLDGVMKSVVIILVMAFVLMVSGAYTG